MTATANRVLASFPNAAIANLDHFLRLTIQVVNLIYKGVEGKRPPQHLWLFELAGRLKGALPEELRTDPNIGSRLAPLSLVFVDGLEAWQLLTSKTTRIQWDDADAVMLEFEEIWYRRKFAKGSPFLDEAVAFAFQNRLNLTGNIHFVRLLNVAYYLQSQQPGLPILLPVSSVLAKKLHTTPVTLGTAVAKAIREGYLEVVDGHFDLKAGKARSFLLQFDHPMLRPAIDRYLASTT